MFEFKQKKESKIHFKAYPEIFIDRPFSEST